VSPSQEEDGFPLVDNAQLATKRAKVDDALLATTLAQPPPIPSLPPN